MELEINVDGRLAKVKEIKRAGNLLTVMVDDDLYDVDLTDTGKGSYSVLYKGKSYNIEVFEKESKHYVVNTFYSSYNMEVIDAETRYMQSRDESAGAKGDNVIKSPMPGKVVKILVNVGDTVEAGQNVIIVSAMKMESEFKAVHDGVVTEIHVKEGDTVDGNQVLIVIE